MSGVYKTYKKLEFTDFEDDYLIKKVKANPTLYEKESKNYKNLKLRDKIWRKISKQMKNRGFEKTAEDCKKRWTNIRDYYLRRLKQVAGSDDTDENEEKFQRLQFLSNYNTLEQRTTRSKAGTPKVDACPLSDDDEEEIVDKKDYLPEIEVKPTQTQEQSIQSYQLTANEVAPIQDNQVGPIQTNQVSQFQTNQVPPEIQNNQGSSTQNNQGQQFQQANQVASNQNNQLPPFQAIQGSQFQSNQVAPNQANQLQPFQNNQGSQFQPNQVAQNQANQLQPFQPDQGTPFQNNQVAPNQGSQLQTFQTNQGSQFQGNNQVTSKQTTNQQLQPFQTDQSTQIQTNQLAPIQTNKITFEMRATNIQQIETVHQPDLTATHFDSRMPTTDQNMLEKAVQEENGHGHKSPVHMNQGRSKRMALRRNIAMRCLPVSQHPEEHIDLFFKSLAATAKTLSPWNVAEVKNKLFNVMSEIEFKDISEKYGTTMPSSVSVMPSQNNRNNNNNNFTGNGAIDYMHFAQNNGLEHVNLSNSPDLGIYR